MHCSKIYNFTSRITVNKFLYNGDIKMGNSNFESSMNQSVRNLVDFVGQKVVNNLVQAKNENKIEVDDNNLRQIITLVQASVSQALTLGYSEIEAVLREHKDTPGLS